MRKIKITEAYSKIFNIRIYVFENILSQIANGDDLNYEANKYLSRIKSLHVKKRELANLILEVTQEDAKNGLRISRLQDAEIKNDIFSVSTYPVSDEVKKLVKYIYENILFYSNYWNTLGEGEFSKMEFKRAFFGSQKNAICPYCDSFEDLELLSFEIDHLLPKSDFPLLYINEMNLIPCCVTCNHQHYGKGNRWNKKYYNLFKIILGLKIKFKFEPTLEIAGIDDISEDFVKLIKLESRYNNGTFPNEIARLKKKVFKDLKKQKTNRTFLDEQAPRYFLIKEIYDYFLKEYGSTF